LTGNLNIIENEKLRELIRKGQNTRNVITFHGVKPKNTYWTELKTMQKDGLNAKMQIKQL